VDWWDAVGCTQSAAEDGISKYTEFMQLFLLNDLLAYIELSFQFSLLQTIFLMGQTICLSVVVLVKHFNTCNICNRQ
jgi:hypothetical protein